MAEKLGCFEAFRSKSKFSKKSCTKHFPNLRTFGGELRIFGQVFLRVVPCVCITDCSVRRPIYFTSHDSRKRFKSWISSLSTRTERADNRLPVHRHKYCVNKWVTCRVNCRHPHSNFLQITKRIQAISEEENWCVLESKVTPILKRNIYVSTCLD